MNNETIIGLGYRVIWIIMQFSMVLSASAADITLLNLHNSSDHTKAEANNCEKRYVYCYEILLILSQSTYNFSTRKILWMTFFRDDRCLYRIIQKHRNV